jgi:hypothetical protein
MAISAIMPIAPAPSVPVRAPDVVEQRGRFSCGQERSAYVARLGSFADGQSRRSAGVVRRGRFSTGQETIVAGGRDREGSYADGQIV